MRHVIAGMVLIGVTYLVMLASLAARGEERVALGVAAMVLNLVLLIAFIWMLALERNPVFEDTCPLGGTSDVPSANHWSWVPPGAVCDYHGGDVGPTYWRIPAGIAIVALPGVWMAAFPYRRRDENDDPLDAVLVNTE
jgi:hypothetical protein